MRLQVRASRFLVSHGRKQKNLPTNHGCGCVLTSLCSCRLSISLSLSFFLYFSRGPLSSLFNRFCFSLHFIRFTFPSLFAPFSISFYLPLLPMRRYLLSLSSLQHFYHHVIFSPSLYPVLLSLSVSIANLPSSLFFVHSSTLSHSHSLAHFLTRSPSHLRQRHLHLLAPHSFSYAYSLAPFLSCRYRLCPTRGLGRVLSSLDNLPPSHLYSVLPSRNRAENLRIEPSRALLSGRKKDRRIGGRYA